MFETSVVQARALDSRRSRYSLLTLSLFAHGAVVAGALAISIATVEFPSVAPDEYSRAPVFASFQMPPPLGRPDGGGKPQVTPPKQEQKQPAPAPTQITAPAVVPDDVTPADATGPATNSDATGPGDGRVPGPIGVEWGDPNSPGDLNAPPATLAPPRVENKIYTVSEVKPPVIIDRVEPQYPPAFLRVKMPGDVIVRCVIDKNGRIRDAQVVFATKPPFGEAVLRVLKDWRYQPASLGGQAVDCYLDLTVHFGVK